MITELNQEQQKAVNHSDSPLLIVAGPGSGKTRVIIERIIHLANNGIKPSEILCLTFTKKAAEVMSQRLENNDVFDVDINTFHSFAKSVLEDNVLESGINISSGVIKRSAQLAWGLKNIDSFEFEYVTIGNNAEDLIRAIIDGIRTFKDELISPETLEKYFDSKNNQKLDEEEQDLVNRLKDLHKVYVKYQEFWGGKSVIDFNDMIVESIKLLNKKPLIRQKLQQKYKHILVDEFQDNNYAQLEIVKLVSTSGNVTVVGDDDQSIFRFQGAYMKNFSDFESYFTNTQVVNLDQNYRSTQNIVNLANSLVANIKERKIKKLFSKNIPGEKIKVRACSNENAEVEFVVQTIKELLGKPIIREDGSEGIVSYEDFAILSRSRKSGVKFVKSLKAHGLPADFVGSENLFATPIVKDVMAYLTIVNSPVTAGREITRLLKHHGITDYNIAKINDYAEKIADSDNPRVDFVLKSLQEIANQAISQKKEILEFVDILHKLSDLSKYQPSDIIYKIIMSISGLYKKAIVENTVENRLNQILLKEIYNYALEYEILYPEGTLDDFISYLNYLFRFDLELPEELEIEDSILVTTIHQSKGKEFQAVFIVDAARDKLPLRSRTKKFYVPKDLAKGLVRDDDEKTLHLLDEKRLLYVAMTRAKSHLYITYAKDYEGRTTEAAPSQFLEEIKFKENPLIDFKEFQASTEIQLEQAEHLERIKQEYQTIAVNSINQMNLGTAIQKIIDLAKIKYFEEYKNLDGFDPEKILKIEPGDITIDSQLYQKKIPLIKKEDFRLSPSKLQTYEDCPLQFKFQHVLRVPTPSKTFFSMGTAIHSVAENLTKMQKDGLKPTEKLGLEILEKQWDPSSYRNQRTKESEDRVTSKEMIKTYLEWSEKNPNTPVDVEAKFKIILNDVTISGKIDRVEMTPNGDYEVIDFKTGYTYKTKNTIKEDVQMNVYALGTEKLYGKLPTKTSLFYIKHNKIVTHFIEEEKLNEFKEKLSEEVESIFNEEFPAKPDSWKCSRCDYATICDEKELG
jgi:DNA helicase-2/ATP-dependent DNA helicase PcrA